MAVLSHGATLSYDVSNSPVEVAGVRKITAAKTKVTSVKVTTLSSADHHHEFIPGLIDADKIGADLVFTEAQCTALTNLKNARTVTKWTITFSSGGTWHCQGFIESLAEGDADEDKELTGNVEIKLTGKPTWTPA